MCVCVCVCVCVYIYICVFERDSIFLVKYHHIYLFLPSFLPSYFSFQPVLHDWCTKGSGMWYRVYGMVHVKEPLLLLGKSSPGGGSGFPLLSASLNYTFPSFIHSFTSLLENILFEGKTPPPDHTSAGFCATLSPSTSDPRLIHTCVTTDFSENTTPATCDAKSSSGMTNSRKFDVHSRVLVS